MKKLATFHSRSRNSGIDSLIDCSRYRIAVQGAWPEKKNQRKCIGTVLVKDLTWLAIVPLALAHLVAVFAQHQSKHDAVAKRMRIGLARIAGDRPAVRCLLPR